MKRLLLICSLFMLTIASPNLAKAASFAWGPDYFDDQLTLTENLAQLLANNDTSAMAIAFDDLNIAADQYVSIALIGFSNYVVFDNVIMKSGDTNVSSATETVLAWPNVDSKILPFGSFRLHDTESDTYYTLPELAPYLWMVMDDVAYQPEGVSEAYIIPAGSYVFGFAAEGSGNALDAIFVLKQFNSPAVPLPGAVWLLGSGIAGLVALRRKNK